MSNRIIIATNPADIAIAAIYATNSRKKYTLITRTQHKDCADSFHSFSEVVLLDGDLIRQTLNSPLVHDGIAVNAIWDKLSTYQDICEEIVNISQNRLSSLITSYLNPKNYSGAKVNSFNDLMYKTKIDAYFATSNKNDLYLNRIEGILFSDNINFTSKPILNPDQNFENICRNNFTKIRGSFNGEKTHIIGIDLKCCSVTKFETIEKIIRDIQVETNFFPVLLADKNADKTQLEAINYLNSQFNNSLLTVRSDSKALISVLTNLDLIITSDSFTITFADMTDTPSIQFCSSLNNLTDYSLYSNYIFDLSRISPEFTLEVCDVTNNILNGHKIENINGLFKIKTGKLGRYPHGISEEQNTKMLLKRMYLNVLHTGDKISTNNLNLSKDIVKQLCSAEKVSILDLGKLILSSIRLLKSKSNNKSATEQFINNIDQILRYCDSDNMLSIACKMFQNEINLLPKSNSKANSIVAEKILFNLKNDLKVLNSIMDELVNISPDITTSQPRI